MKTPHKWYIHLSLYWRNNRGVYCSCMPLTYWCDHPATVCVRAHPSRTGVRPPPPVYTPAERRPPLHWYPHPLPAVTMNGVSGSKHARACVSKSKTLNTCNFSDILVPRPHADYGQTTDQMEGRDSLTFRLVQVWNFMHHFSPDTSDLTQIVQSFRNTHSLLRNE